MKFKTFCCNIIHVNFVTQDKSQIAYNFFLLKNYHILKQLFCKMKNIISIFFTNMKSLLKGNFNIFYYIATEFIKNSTL